MNTQNKVVSLAVVVGLVVGFGFGYLLWGIKGAKNVVKKATESAEKADLEASAIASTGVFASSDIAQAENQVAGKSVIVSKVKLSATSWVAVHEDRAGELGNVLGARRFAQGEYQNSLVPLLRGTTSGQKYYVGIYKENGDGKFDRKTDTLLHGEDGEMIGSTFVTN